ncbi:MAG: thioesterase family protein [Alphaproteobacteria bacterium]|nr:thioesterase family protein [Alphaproteobacteria bacterium]
MPAQPLDLYHARVQAEWIDYNGHMNLAFYVLVFDKATDALLDRLGIGEDYRRRTECTTFVLEAHLTYEREVKKDAPLRVATQLIDADEKRLHLFHIMYHGETGHRLATNELLSLHVDLAGPHAAPFPEAARPAIAALLAEHRTLPRPRQLGRTIGIRRR